MEKAYIVFYRNPNFQDPQLLQVFRCKDKAKEYIKDQRSRDSYNYCYWIDIREIR